MVQRHAVSSIARSTSDSLRMRVLAARWIPACAGMTRGAGTGLAALAAPPYSPGLMQEYAFAHRHLLAIDGLSRDDIEHILDLAATYAELSRQAARTTPRL